MPAKIALRLKTKSAKRLLQKHSRPTLLKFIYSFSEGRADMKELLGGKGAVLADMTH